ncbi:MAG: YceI family protein [Gemmatimonadota bacterium]|nr:YceI family protein [Gemmatimonadota bacterium]
MATTQTPAPSTAASNWQIDPAHTLVEFSAKHMMITTVKGRFHDVSGTVVGDSADVRRSRVDVTIATASLTTSQEQRDTHLRSGDFLDAEKYPSIRFVSSRIEPTSKDSFRLIGNLTIRDVTREIVLEVTAEGEGKDPWGGQRAGFSGRGSLDRRQFGLEWNQALETGGFLVGNEIKIALEVQLVKAKI